MAGEANFSQKCKAHFKSDTLISITPVAVKLKRMADVLLHCDDDVTHPSRQEILSKYTTLL